MTTPLTGSRYILKRKADGMFYTKGHRRTGWSYDIQKAHQYKNSGHPKLAVGHLLPIRAYSIRDRKLREARRRELFNNEYEIVEIVVHFRIKD